MSTPELDTPEGRVRYVVQEPPPPSPARHIRDQAYWKCYAGLHELLFLVNEDVEPEVYYAGSGLQHLVDAIKDFRSMVYG